MIQVLFMQHCSDCHMCMHAGDVSITSRLGYLVDELQKVQMHLSVPLDPASYGYLSAFPFEHFERLEALQPVWAPFYVVSALCCIPGACNDCMGPIPEWVLVSLCMWHWMIVLTFHVRCRCTR